MITLPELLEDKQYRKFFSTVPKNGATRINWRIYIQRETEGRWLRKDFEKYPDAFRRLAKELKEGRLHDGTIQSRGIAYAPPQRIVKLTRGGRPAMVKGPGGKLVQRTALVVWKPKLGPHDESHTWCPYCRRPVVFKWFANHHALRNSPVAGCIDIGDRRCVICGGREEFIRESLKAAALPGHSITSNSNKRARRR